MLFNSVEFIFGFFPVVALVFFGVYLDHAAIALCRPDPANCSVS